MESKNETQLKPKKKILRGWVLLQRIKVQSGVGKVTISPPPESKSPEAENSRHCPPRPHPPSSRGTEHPGRRRLRIREWGMGGTQVGEGRFVRRAGGLGWVFDFCTVPSLFENTDFYLMNEITSGTSLASKDRCWKRCLAS